MLATAMDVRSSDGALVVHYSPGDDVDMSGLSNAVLAPCVCEQGFFVPSGTGPIATVAAALEHLRVLADLGDEAMPHTAPAARLALACIAELDAARARVAELEELACRCEDMAGRCWVHHPDGCEGCDGLPLDAPPVSGEHPTRDAGSPSG